jgi:protein TonB
LYQVAPDYPEQARLAGVAGTVVLRTQVLTSGYPGEITVFRSSGDTRLDESALSAVRKWRFVPAKYATTGRPTNCYTKIPVVFRLR